MNKSLHQNSQLIWCKLFPFTDPSLASTFSPMAVGAVGAFMAMMAVEVMDAITINTPKVSPKTPEKAINNSPLVNQK